MRTTVLHRSFVALFACSVIAAGLAWPVSVVGQAAAPAAPVTPPALKTESQTPTAKLSPQRWEKAIAAFERADQQDPPPHGGVLFIGSSGIVRWKTLAEDFPEYKVINRGFGGSIIADSVYFVDRIVVPYQPRLIVLRAGTNDIAAGKTPEQVAADFRAFVEKVQAKLPAVKIAFISLNQTPKRWANRERERKADSLIRDYIASHKNLDYIDTTTGMLGPDGKPREELFVGDHLHCNAEGYKLWTAIVRPHLAALLGGPSKLADEKEFTSLFDGHTLEGWEGNLEVFRIEEGAVVGGSLAQRVARNEFLCTKKEYGDFELRLKFKLLGQGANGGVQVRSQRIPSHHEMIGYQADMGDGVWGTLYDESRRRKCLAGPPVAERGQIVHHDDWNDYVIRCEGRRVQLWVNGQQTVDYTEDDLSLVQRGLIGLQIHGGKPSEAWYKEVRIKELGK